MMNIVKVIKMILVAIPFVIPLAVLAESKELPGKEKKDLVVADLMAELAKLGFAFPGWLERFVTPLLGLIVDVVVMIMNQNGFFNHGEENSPI